MLLPLNRFPRTGKFPTPGVCDLLLNTLFFFIPPITTISPSATKSFVEISILFMDGSPAFALFTVLLLTIISNSTLPSPIMLGVTVSFNAASLNEVSAPSDPVA